MLTLQKRYICATDECQRLPPIHPAGLGKADHFKTTEIKGPLLFPFLLMKFQI